MPELKRLQAGDAPAVLAFERANRGYFAAFISDRGDEFFDQFADRYGALLAEQEAGISAFYVLVAEDGSVLGRFNLYDFEDGAAVLGYRVAQHAAGRGVATATVLELCRLAAARHGLRTLRAATSRDNVASQRVLAKAGFVPVGPADPAEIGGKPGTWYQRDLEVQPLPGRLGDLFHEGVDVSDDVPRTHPRRAELDVTQFRAVHLAVLTEGGHAKPASSWLIGSIMQCQRDLPGGRRL